MESLTPAQETDENLRQWKYHQGLEGIPFRTKEDTVPLYKGPAAEHRKPRQVVDMFVDQFNLRDKDERAALQSVLDLCAKGKGYISRQEVEFDSTVKGWRVLLIWGKFFLEDPVETDRANIAGDTQSFS